MEKPTCEIVGTDGNVFALIGRVAKTLNEAGLRDQAKEMSERAFDCRSYEEVLIMFREYVEIT